jgi:hypothetical protein
VKNVKKLLKQKVVQNVTITLSYLIFLKIIMNLQK